MRNRMLSRPPSQLLVLVAALAWPPALRAQATASPEADDLSGTAIAESAGRIRMVVDSVMKATGIPGLSAAVSVGGEVIWSEGFGYADVENRTPATPLTRFRIGSVSKPLTAAALGILLEEGKLDLDAPVQRYVPDFPEKRWPVTTRQLAGHLAGMRHYRGLEFLSNERYETVSRSLDIFAGDPLLHEPGTRYSYSSYGWNLISAVVEGASGKEFLPFMQSRVFDLLALRHTVADHTDSLIAFRTRYYEPPDGGRVSNSPAVDNSYKWAGGGFLSTSEDLVRFADAHLTGELLTPETVEILWTSQRTADGKATGYGLGWRIGQDDDGRRTVAHGGGSVGGTTGLVLFPEHRVAVAVVANMTDAPLGAIMGAIAQEFLP